MQLLRQIIREHLYVRSAQEIPAIAGDVDHPASLFGKRAPDQPWVSIVFDIPSGW